MKQVVMLGPSPAARGGMASVIQTYLAHGYEDGGRCRFIATHVDGAPWRKAARAGAALCQLTGLLLRGRVALLHVHVASGVSFWRKAVFIGAARLFRVPVLFHLHGGQFAPFVDARLSGWRQRLALRTIGASAAAFALSDASAAWLRTRAGLARVQVFPNPIAGSTPPARLPWAERREILFIGRLEQAKGVFDLLRAFARVLAARPDARLVLAGDGDRTAVAALAAELGIAPSVELAGWVDAAARARLLARAAVMVLPSYQEQMPMVILESMAAGTPVIATSVGAVPLMLSQGKCGILVQAGDFVRVAASILRIMDDNILADTLSAAGRQQVLSSYIAEHVMENLRRRYEEYAV